MLRLIVLCLCFYAGTIYAQSPDWIEGKYRESHYPQELYYIGFATYQKQKGEAVNNAISEVKTMAYNQLSQSIIMNVNVSSTSAMTAINNNGEYSESELYKEVSTITSASELSNTKLFTYYDEDLSIAYAFAVVQKDELIRNYTRKLDVFKQRVQDYLGSAEIKKERNEKSLAIAECDTIYTILPKITDCLKMLIVIDPTFQYKENLAQLSVLKHKTDNLHSALNQSIMVILELKGAVHSDLKELLYSEIMNVLTENNCSLAKDGSIADYKICVDIETRFSSSDGEIIYVYSDAQAKLCDECKKKVIYINNYSAKGGASSEDKAQRKALIKVSKLIAEDIIKKIK